MWKILAFLVLLSAPSFTQKASLYSDEDFVHELFTEDINDKIYNSADLWVVEFYSDWCGHCQRFSPTWKALAEMFKAWDQVKIAAINCAQEIACGDFAIEGTPTIRMFEPGEQPGSLGDDIMARQDIEFLLHEVLVRAQLVQMSGKLSKIPKLESLKDGNEARPNKHGQKGQSLTLIFEDEAFEGVGRYLMLSLANKFPKLRVGRVAFNYVETVGRKLLRDDDKFPDEPSVILLKNDNGTVFNKKYDTFHVLKYADELNGPLNDVADQVGDWLKSLLNIEDVSEEDEEEASFTLIKVDPDRMENRGESKLFVSDLEKGIQYSLFNEILVQDEMNQEDFKAFFNWINALYKFSPVGAPLKSYLGHLRDRLSKEASNLTFTNDYLRDIMESIPSFNEIFDDSSDWVGCKGSKPHLRGYPCSLWQNFHALTVGFYNQDQMDSGGNIQDVIIQYVRRFFTCRHCAENFEMELQVEDYKIRKSPVLPEDVILWLVGIHNHVNERLSGDETEDPRHPKTLWPSKNDCNICSESRQSLIEYAVKFYTPTFPEPDKKLSVLEEILDDFFEPNGNFTLYSDMANRIKDEYC